jgi:hypothetical protein
MTPSELSPGTHEGEANPWPLRGATALCPHGRMQSARTVPGILTFTPGLWD